MLMSATGSWAELQKSLCDARKPQWQLSASLRWATARSMSIVSAFSLTPPVVQVNEPKFQKRLPAFRIREPFRYGFSRWLGSKLLLTTDARLSREQRNIRDC